MMTANTSLPTSPPLTLLQIRPNLGASPDGLWIESLLRKLADSVDLIHRAGCAHLAISPDRVIFSADGQPALLGDGAPCGIGPEAAPGAANAALPRSPSCANFLAPEQDPDARSGATSLRAPGPWSDIYGLAAVAYFALTGAAPAAPSPGVATAGLRPRGSTDTTEGEVRQFETLWRGIEQGLAFEPMHRPHDVPALMLAFGLPERRLRPRGRSESLLMCGATFDPLASTRWAANSDSTHATFADTQWLGDSLGSQPPPVLPATPARRQVALAPQPGAAVAANRPTRAERQAPLDRVRRQRSRRPDSAVRLNHSVQRSRITDWLLVGVSTAALLLVMAAVVNGAVGRSDRTAMARQTPAHPAPALNIPGPATRM